MPTTCALYPMGEVARPLPDIAPADPGAPKPAADLDQLAWSIDLRCEGVNHTAAVQWPTAGDYIAQTGDMAARRAAYETWRAAATACGVALDHICMQPQHASASATARKAAMQQLDALWYGSPASWHEADRWLQHAWPAMWAKSIGVVQQAARDTSPSLR